MKKTIIGLAGASVLLSGLALAQTTHPVVPSLNTADYVEVQQATGSGHQFTTLANLSTFFLGTGTRAVANGGTGATSFTAHGVLLGEGTSAVTPTAAGTTGQLLQGVTSADPAWATTLSGAYTFSNALVTFGNAAGTPTHIATAQTTAPALTSCGGGSPAITGTDEAGIVTMGSSATGCVITFNVAYTGTPFCVVSWIATPLASQSYVTSNTAITTTQTSTSGNKLQYICRAPAGG